MTRRNVILIGQLMLIALCMVGCKSKAKDLEPPVSYEVGGVSVPSMDQTMGEEGGKLSQVEELGDEKGSTSAVGVVYTYTLSGGGAAVETYLQTLTGETEGFQIVDDTLSKAEAPDFSASEGMVSLVKTSTTQGKLLKMDLNWTEKDCVVRVEEIEGALKEETVQPLSAIEAVNFLNSRSPATLGLEGSSMREYNVYFMEGEVRVDRRPCVRLSVYRPDAQGGQNVFVGTYLLSADQMHLYRAYGENEDAVEIPLR